MDYFYFLYLINTLLYHYSLDLNRCSPPARLVSPSMQRFIPRFQTTGVSVAQNLCFACILAKRPGPWISTGTCGCLHLFQAYLLCNQEDTLQYQEFGRNSEPAVQRTNISTELSQQVWTPSLHCGGCWSICSQVRGKKEKYDGPSSYTKGYNLRNAYFCFTSF